MEIWFASHVELVCEIESAEKPETLDIFLSYINSDESSHISGKSHLRRLIRRKLEFLTGENRGDLAADNGVVR